MEALFDAIFRWFHVVAGIIWIGHLYFFNWVNIPFAATLDPETRRRVVPELVPRALFWFRWGAAWTWITGVILLMILYYHGKAAVEGQRFIAGSWVMIAFSFLGVFAYDALMKSKLAKDRIKIAYLVAFAILGLALFLMASPSVGNFSYRGLVIHTGVLFGTIMAFNVWFRIWPAQQKIVTAVKNGEAPDQALVGMAGLRSRHNTYLSVPLIWTMIAQHTTYFAGGNLGIPHHLAWLALLILVLLGWHVVFQLYRKSTKVKGF